MKWSETKDTLMDFVMLSKVAIVNFSIAPSSVGATVGLRGRSEKGNEVRTTGAS